MLHQTDRFSGIVLLGIPVVRGDHFGGRVAGDLHDVGIVETVVLEERHRRRPHDVGRHFEGDAGAFAGLCETSLDLARMHPSAGSGHEYVLVPSAPADSEIW